MKTNQKLVVALALFTAATGTSSAVQASSKPAKAPKPAKHTKAHKPTKSPKPARTTTTTPPATTINTSTPATTMNPSPSTLSSISGQVVFNATPAKPIPAGATVTIELLDSSLADAPSVTLGKQVITDAVSFPINFTVTYDPAKISQANKDFFYTVSVRIEKGPKLLFINDTYNFPFKGNPAALVVPVVVVK